MWDLFQLTPHTLYTYNLPKDAATHTSGYILIFPGKQIITWICSDTIKFCFRDSCITDL